MDAADSLETFVRN